MDPRTAGGPRGSRRWTRCAADGCDAAAPGGAERCLAHLDSRARSAYLAGAASGDGVDARGVTVDRALLALILDAAGGSRPPERDAAGGSRPPERDAAGGSRPPGRALAAARFDGARFPDGADFTGVTFRREVSFDGAVFEREASFSGAEFGGHARFGRAHFQAVATFGTATFRGQAWVAAAHFDDDVDFGGARFAGPAWFGGARFGADASFSGAVFAADASFDRAAFGCHALFDGAEFRAEARLSEAAFAREPSYRGAVFRGASGAPPGAAGQAAWTGARLARWRSRAAAALLDASGPVAVLAGSRLVVAGLERLTYSGVEGPVTVAAALLAVTLALRALLRQGDTGWTPGKRRLGLSLVDHGDGRPVGRRRSVVRAGLHVLDALPLGLGFVWPIWDRRHQTFADKLAGSVVVEHQGWAGAVAREAAAGAGHAGFS